MKYMGSKSRFAKAIYSRICELSPRNNRPWVEPFAGGMNLICKVPPEHGPRYANDANPYLIEMFKAILCGWIPPKFVDRELYEKCKRLEGPAHLIGYVGFNCSYSGKFFGGYAGKVVTKTGKTRDYQSEAFLNVTKQALELNGVMFCSASYSEIQIPENSIIYCDPPYSNTTDYKIKFDSIAFWQWVREKSKLYTVFVSEYEAPSDFECCLEIKATSSLSANGKSGANKVSTEKLFRIKSNV